MTFRETVTAHIPKASYFSKEEVDLAIALLEMYRDVMEKAGEKNRSDDIWNTTLNLLDGFYSLRVEKNNLERAKAGLM